MHTEGQRGVSSIPRFPVLRHSRIFQIFHQVALTSKHLEHPNIVPLLGVTMEPLALVSDWMPGGDLPGYIAERPDAYKPVLVRTSTTALFDALIPPAIRRRRRPPLPPFL